jgi:crossover junction endodeoxyribonuclease RuvC
MKILGVDPGYGRLGYAIFEYRNGKEWLMESSCIETSGKMKFGARILKLAQDIEKLITKHKPKILVIEKIYFNKNQKTALLVSEIKGVVVYLALKNHLKVLEYTPLEVKTAICGYGRASKKAVKKMIRLLTGLDQELKSDDTADAIALCLTYFSRKDSEFIRNKQSVF